MGGTRRVLRRSLKNRRPRAMALYTAEISMQNISLMSFGAIGAFSAPL